MSSAAATPTAPKKQENLLLSLIFNVAVPSLIMSKLSSPEHLGPINSLLIALAFPIGYSIYDFATRKTWSFITVLGFLSLLLTGILGLLAADGLWFAIKEAAIPALIGLVTIATIKTRRPLVRTLLYNDAVIDTERVASALESRNATRTFEQTLALASWLLAGSFFLSAALNFGLARYFLKSPPGTPEFTAELGSMNAWSWPVIVIPSTATMMAALWFLMTRIQRHSGLSFEEILKQKPAQKSSPE